MSDITANFAEKDDPREGDKLELVDENVNRVRKFGSIVQRDKVNLRGK